MIEGTVQLLARHVLQATSFSEVLELTGAPRGSVYHYFPDGKEQLIASAVALAGARALEYLDRRAGALALEVTEYFLHLWREVLSRSRFGAGCAVLAVTVASDSPELLRETAAVFRAWRERLAGLLERGGLAPREAARFAATLVASTEGAVVLSRSEQSMEPFDLVAGQLLEQVKSVASSRHR
jgi:AcrR family transcriptional regulator